MPTTLESVVTKYLRSGNPAQRTREEYATTLRKWSRWGGDVPLEQLARKEIREFLATIDVAKLIAARKSPANYALDFDGTPATPRPDQRPQ